MRFETFRAIIAASAALLAAACSTTADVNEPASTAGAVIQDGVHYSATTAVMESFPVQLRTTVTVENRGTQPVQLQFPDGCTVLLRAYRTAERQQPVWDQAADVGCTMAIQIVDLAPGARREFSTSASARDVLGSRLADGRYYLAAYLRPNGTVVEVPAGAADLAVPR